MLVLSVSMYLPHLRDGIKKLLEGKVFFSVYQQRSSAILLDLNRFMLSHEHHEHCCQNMATKHKASVCLTGCLGSNMREINKSQTYMKSVCILKESF